ncbi:MAG: hypothetical protein F6K26_43750 [Moorea sp. SIO2I5]|nr:hypothetical protein [Moorena sp. SIO2I5]
MIPINLGLWPRYANNQITYPSPNPKGEQPTNLGQKAKLSPTASAARTRTRTTLAFGHATRTTFNFQLSTFNLQPNNLPYTEPQRRTTN